MLLLRIKIRPQVVPRKLSFGHAFYRQTPFRRDRLIAIDDVPNPLLGDRPANGFRKRSGQIGLTADTLRRRRQCSLFLR